MCYEKWLWGAFILISISIRCAIAEAQDFRVMADSMKTQNRSSVLGEEPGWVWKNPLPQGNTLADLHLSRPNSVLAVGSGGGILTTDDGGASWKRTKNIADASQQINDIFFVNDTLAWAVGTSDLVMNSFDGGQCWFPVKTPIANISSSPGVWNAVHFTSPSIGWIAGFYWRRVNDYGEGKVGVILKTTNAGRSWKRHLIGTGYDNFDTIVYALFFLSSQTGFALGHNGGVHTVYKTDDGGTTWLDQALAEGPGQDLLAIHFSDFNHGWIVGKSGTIFHTADGGKTWVLQISSTTQALNDVFFSDNQYGWAAGEAGTLLVSKDGGLRWQASTSPTTANLLAVKFSDRANGWAAGLNGEILRSKNGGQSWSALHQSFTETRFNEIVFTDAKTAWLLGDHGALFLTTDAGLHWSTKPSSTTSDLRRGQFLNPDTGWIVGVGVLLKTTNGGKEWNPIYTWTTDVRDLHGTNFQFLNSSIGVLTDGGNGAFRRTEDGGRNWIVHYAGIAGPKYNVHFFNADTGLVFGQWASGGTGAITITYDGGKTWKYVGAGPSKAWDVFFLNRKIGWAAGGPLIYKTGDGGGSWTGPVRFPGLVRAIHFVDSNLGYAVGEGGVVFYTTDGGSEWSRLHSGTNINLYSIAFTSALTGWITGENGALLKTTNGGLDTSKIVCTPPDTLPEPPEYWPPPTSFTLYQNAPNPFKEYTAIDYVINGRGRVTLKVYDLIGRHVRTLVDAAQSEETIYTVRWRGENAAGKRLPAGIYFYRFEAGRLTQTKKMILLR